MDHSLNMITTYPRRRPPRGLLRRPPRGLLALALAALTLAVATSPAAAHHGAPPPGKQRLVLRGDATAIDGPCDALGCPLELSDGHFRGAPVGTGTYTASFRLKVAEQFPNGEGGICAPLVGRIALGAGTSDRLVLAVSGDSCQDGAGPLTGASFTGLAEFTVKHGTGRYARAGGGGVASFTEDAAKHHRMTLIGRIGSAR
jgi:hypothetical protein